MVFPEGSVERELDFAGSKPLPPAVKPKPKARPKSIQNVPINSNPATSKPKPPVAPPRRPTTASSNDTFLSASSGQSRGLESPERGRSRNSAPMLPSRARPSSAQSMLIDTSPRRQNPVPPPPRRSQASASTSSNLPLNSLTNATMAGILASSRATPSIKSTPLPPAAPPLRRQTPRLRQTLRKPSSRSDEEDEYHARFKHRKKPLQKSKHSHHEGARRRWREEITLRERKRYEGVWASNRGLLLTNSPSHSPDPISLTRSNSSTPNSGNLPNPHNPKPPTHGTDLVSNVIVRDMWARSRLPFDELSEVWDLVDTQGRGVLDKTEFVVGMWLVDQRLRGRKIPQKVMGSVWGSAKGLTVESPYREKGRGRRH
ncbi:hypothetical protein BJ170DRAFT_623021 [Xylariales sp. AK1849]|nr:hypothetical protein BJ170DRAFT_623021 [Xylariales sp. AK1849]